MGPAIMGILKASPNPVSESFIKRLNCTATCTYATTDATSPFDGGDENQLRDVAKPPNCQRVRQLSLDTRPKSFADKRHYVN
jgi:hypothetical protein